MNPQDFARLAGMTGQQPRPQQQGNPLENINPANFEDEVCKACSNPYFDSVLKVKKLSHLHPDNPTGQDIRSAQQVLICTKCGTELPQQ